MCVWKDRVKCQVGGMDWVCLSGIGGSTSLYPVSLPPGSEVSTHAQLVSTGTHCARASRCAWFHLATAI